MLKAALAGAASTLLAGDVFAQDTTTPDIQPGENGPPNILVIMPDDVGYWNTSAYNLGVMGYRTPNIDRIAREGMQFTDAYGEQSCTAGRAAFITGQTPFRTGLLSIGLPGEETGIHPDDPTIAELLGPLGYATGQFGKNHLGDRNNYLPTVHGFDEFFGILYHLNAYEEPEDDDYPQNPVFAERYGPRNVIRSWATEYDDPTEDPRFGRVGKQVVEDAGPLDTTRMETIDEEFLWATKDFIGRAHANDQPFFAWFNPTRMHIFTHLKPESRGVTGLGIQADGMVEHDGHVGDILQYLDDLGIADNTIVIYTTDNGAQVLTWPDGNMTPFRGEKNGNWEGAYRVPMMVRWPNQIPAGVISNEMISLQDWLPTLLAAAGVPDIAERLLAEHEAGDRTFRAHLDGFNQLDHLVNGGPSARHQFFYFSGKGQLLGYRQDRWKFILMEQESTGLDGWYDEFRELRAPKIVDLRGDPLERAMIESGNYDTWVIEHLYLLSPVQDSLKQFYLTFVEFPPRGVTGQLEQLQQLLEMLNGSS
ncbi:MAG TPA: arylsulfatase [Thermomicrobiales bacterium]|nr:arylsulfatase [Thermomicrobiales bacterium]